MEVNTTITVCPYGHTYDSAKYSTCPRCSAEAGGAFPKTENVSSPAMASDNVGFDPTVPNSAADFGKTEPANHATPIKPTEPVDYKTEQFPHTIFAPDFGSNIPPVVGWLVCIDGEEKGRDFRLHHEYNSIGREMGDVVIHGDNAISHADHAKILFNGEKFYFIHDKGKTSERINGESVLLNRELNNYDVITIGNTKLMFVAFCGDKFDWPKGK